MAQTALPGSVLIAYAQGKIPGQKLLAVAPTESFSALVQSAHGRLVQMRGAPSGMVLVPQNPKAATPHAGYIPTPSAPAGKLAARGKSNTGQEQETDIDPASPPLTPIPIPLSMRSTPNLAVASVPLPKSASATPKLCENTETTDPATSGVPVAIAPPTAIATMATEPTAPPPAIEAVLIEPMAEQVAGPMTDLHKSAPANARSTLPEDTSDTPSADLPALPAYQFLPQPIVNGPLPMAPDRAAEKVSIDKPDADAIASPDSSVAQLAALTSNPGLAPIARTETNLAAMNAPAMSTTTSMAEANRAVALRVSRAIASGEETLTIELHPADLGHVAVHLAFHDTGVEVRMVVSRQETYQAFSQDRAALEQQFSQAGVDLGAGGLDLQYSQTQAQQPKQASAPGLIQPDDGVSETNNSTVFLGDNLVNIVA